MSEPGRVVYPGEWNGQAIKGEHRKTLAERERHGEQGRESRIFPEYSREIEIGSRRRNRANLLATLQKRGWRVTLADSLARVESKSGRLARDRSSRQIF